MFEQSTSTNTTNPNCLKFMTIDNLIYKAYSISLKQVLYVQSVGKRLKCSGVLWFCFHFYSFQKYN